MSNLLQIAKYDLWSAKMGINLRTDEAAIRNGAYHVQQAIEKTLKFILNANNINYARTHDLGVLIAILQSNGVIVPDYIVRIAIKVTRWESEVRYVTSLRVGYNEVIDAINKAETLINDTANTYNIQLLD